ncbi:adenosylhomocysteinase [Agrobacterium sp. rho-13.3]|uniref:adenosylhomocysteinase n=1 Tax=Agrobacterium sp. rho-13.3 TaxID=3072980 RepID=UPI002A0E1C40|nr:adenosylhomocysteinase [Agrobacterium sp. rho-13.3]MDX8308130.1 adenosylhomocysteinase [Agrobacterium sp. rho-13.3]
MTRQDQLSRIEWVANSCPLLKTIAEEFSQTQPFRGLTIGTAIHLEPKTVALLLTLRAGGASLVVTGNLNSTQPETVEYLERHQIDVIGGKTTDAAAHSGFIDALLDRKPDLLLDNGGDLFGRVADRPYKNLLGGTEETTSGRRRLAPMRVAIGLPVLVINDSPIKQFAENRHAVGQSLFESYMRFTNRSTNGKRVTVFGYGACGKGTAACFRHAYSAVSVVDTDPVTALEAHLDGFSTPLRRDAITSADLIITVTGFADVITAADLPLFKDGVILMNGGHFPTEIDVDDIKAVVGATRIDRYAADGIETLHLEDGRKIHILGGGHMANLAGARPLGNSVESMDLGFALQARCLERVAGGQLDHTSCVVPVPADIDAKVASAYLDLNR